MFLHMQHTKQFKRVRGVFQILMTLVSFLGFNEAVLAERYRTSLYIKSDNTRMIVVNKPMTEPLRLRGEALNNIPPFALSLSKCAASILRQAQDERETW